MRSKGVNNLRELKNTYDYDLSRMVVILVKEDGEIIGGFDEKTDHRIGSKFRLPGSPSLVVKDVKRILVVEEN